MDYEVPDQNSRVKTQVFSFLYKSNFNDSIIFGTMKIYARSNFNGSWGIHVTILLGAQGLLLFLAPH